MRQLLIAMQFLTILPVKIKGDLSGREIAGSAVCFPVVGFLQGLLLFAASIISARFFTADIAAAFIMALMIVINGAFHLDGLADTFDAIGLKSSASREADVARRLEVMKDSTTGAIGVVAVVMVLLIKFSLIKGLISSAPVITALGAIALMPLFSRWIMVPALYHGTAARRDGLGSLFIGNISVINNIGALGITIFVFAGYAFLYAVPAYGIKGSILLAVIPLGYLLAMSAVSFGKAFCNGLTGDIVGALSEISEIFYLTGVFIWLQHFI